MNPGEIYWADLDSGRRPVVVVSRESLNRGRYVVAVLFTIANRALRSTLPNCVSFQAGEFGLPEACVAQCETVSFIESSRLDFTSGLIGALDAEKLREIVQALGYVFCAECE